MNLTREYRHDESDARMKHIWFTLLLLLPLSCDADELNCRFTREFIEHITPADKQIVQARWQDTTDKDSGEYVTRLQLKLKGNATALIEHKFCEIYNFEYTYTSKRSSLLTKTDIASQVEKAFQYAKIKPGFKKSLGQIVTDALTQQAYNPVRSLAFGLPVDQVISKDNVEYGIEYHPKGERQETTLIFYMSIGGL